MESGILLIDKPVGLSSAAVVAKIKHKFRLKKVGHGGTLDPFASGLLVLLIGEGTKIARFLLAGNKTYEAEALLGAETDTGDLTGKPIETGSVAPLSEFQATLPKFLGTISQRPPQYSAIKRDGKPLYAYARAGETVAVEPRDITIHDLEILDLQEDKLRFRVTCSGGTYIRVLAQDWARAAGTRAHLTALRRTDSHSFSLASANTLDSALALAELPLISIEDSLAHLPRINCDQKLTTLIRNGNSRALESISTQWTFGDTFALAMENDRAVAILSKNSNQNGPVIERVFDSPAREA
jgi:tRNA pseudouridine55 synthase